MGAEGGIEPESGVVDEAAASLLSAAVLSAAALPAKTEGFMLVTDEGWGGIRNLYGSLSAMGFSNTLLRQRRRSQSTGTS